MRKALRYRNERYVEDAGLSGLGPWHDEIVAAGIAEDWERYREAVRGYVRAGLRALDQAQKGAA